MNNVWYALVRFFQSIFVPPKSTPFERFLIAQVNHLESELNRERDRADEKYSELLERFVPTIRTTENDSSEVKVIGNSKLTWADRQAQLERASKERHDERWREHIKSLELDNENLETKIKTKSKLEGYSTAPE